ncbi:diguanylate cyclase [Pseudomonas berkeleyensis]|uniref:Diguanylate cyclase n=1 Tax=Pseudomonas berkeleyensis TaxID=2726956 RepID=A0A7G5DTG9_9PSED|nr:diguanylate cyclase [Pseudomonas berkeleyensis]QMV65044.1 diguanylate cyclase [Pseudomonas berkeleyensis]WSO40513.1 diguanylate cyclase [Pseudomonas berkeleyensis]
MFKTIGRVERKLVALVALFYLSLMLLIGAIWGSQVSLSSGQSVQDLYRSLYRLSTLLSTLQDAEIGQRGYLLTGNQQYLVPYEQAIGRLDEQLHEMLENPTLQVYAVDLKVIAQLSELKRDELAQTIILRREQGQVEALRVLAANDGKLYMDEMRQRIGNVERGVALSLREQKADLEWRSGLALWGGGGGALLMVALLTLLFSDLRRDLRERAELLERLSFESQHDSLTHLPNRRAFNEALDQALALARRGERHVALLYLDLDGFKPINDQLGHAAGDATLKAVVARWRDVIREGEVLARLGGDEFAVIAAGDAAAVERLAQRLIDALDGPLLEQHAVMRVGVSVGLARYAEHGEDRRRLIAAADTAMYRAKEAGKHCYAWPEATGRGVGG